MEKLYEKENNLELSSHAPDFQGVVCGYTVWHWISFVGPNLDHMGNESGVDLMKFYNLEYFSKAINRWRILEISCFPATLEDLKRRVESFGYECRITEVDDEDEED